MVKVHRANEGVAWSWRSPAGRGTQHKHTLYVYASKKHARYPTLNPNQTPRRCELVLERTLAGGARKGKCDGQSPLSGHCHIQDGAARYS